LEYSFSNVKSDLRTHLTLMVTNWSWQRSFSKL